MKGDFWKSIFVDELQIVVTELLRQTSPDLVTFQSVQ